MVATETTVADEAEAGSEAGSEGEGGSKRAAQYISFPKGAAVWVELEKEAERVGKTPRVLVFELLAGRYGVEVPAVGERAPRRKYASKEEAKAAQKAARDTKNAVIKAFLEQHAAEYQALLAQKEREAQAGLAGAGAAA